MAEWLKAHAWKACIRESVSWVRIPLSPPNHAASGRYEADQCGSKQFRAMRSIGGATGDQYAASQEQGGCMSITGAAPMSLTCVNPPLTIVIGAVLLTLVLKIEAAIGWKMPVVDGAVYRPSGGAPPRAMDASARVRDLDRAAQMWCPLIAHNLRPLLTSTYP
jgi:hypothetical protein